MSDRSHDPHGCDRQGLPHPGGCVDPGGDRAIAGELIEAMLAIAADGHDPRAVGAVDLRRWVLERRRKLAHGAVLPPELAPDPDLYDFAGTDEMGLAVLATLAEVRRRLVTHFSYDPDTARAAAGIVDGYAREHINNEEGGGFR
jgi:hypothetical protein